MAGTIIVGCGGSGCTVVSRLASEGFRCFTINWVDADVSLLPPELSEGDVKRDPDAASRFLSAHHNEISLNIRGFSEVVLVASLGGGIGSASVDEIRKCAEENDCRFILVTTVPFAFEKDRRAAVLSTLSETASLADRTVVMDLQRPEIKDAPVKFALESADGLTCIASRLVAKLIGSIPFFSTFTSPVYSFSRGYAQSLKESFDAAAANPLFSMDVDSKHAVVICTDGPADEHSVEELRSSAIEYYHQVPELVFGDGEGTGLTVFISICPRT